MVNNFRLYANYYFKGVNGVGLLDQRYCIVPPIEVIGRINPTRLMRTNNLNNGFNRFRRSPVELARGVVIDRRKLR